MKDLNNYKIIETFRRNPLISPEKRKKRLRDGWIPETKVKIRKG